MGDYGQLSLQLCLLFSWLACLLPLFDHMHQRFSTLLLGVSSRSFSPFAWYADFFKVSTQSHYHSRSLRRDLLLRILLGIRISIFVVILSVLPLFSDQSSILFPLFSYPAHYFSGAFVLCLFFVAGILLLLIHFLINDQLLPLTAFEDFCIHQMIIILLAFSYLSLPETSALPLSQSVALQNTTLWHLLPRWNAFIQPLSFLLTSIALALYTREWIKNQSLTQNSLIPKGSNFLVGTLSISYRISLSLEQLSLAAFFVTLFLGAYGFLNFELHAWLSLGLYSLKLFCFTGAIVLLSRYLPLLHKGQVLRYLVFIVLPLQVLTYCFTVLF